MAKTTVVNSMTWRDERGKELVTYSHGDDKAVIVPQRCDVDELTALADACTAAVRVINESKKTAKNS